MNPNSGKKGKRTRWADGAGLKVGAEDLISKDLLKDIGNDHPYGLRDDSDENVWEDMDSMFKWDRSFFWMRES